MAGVAIGFVCGFFVFIPLVLLIGSVLLRAAVSLANTVRGVKPQTRPARRERDEWDAPDDDDLDPDDRAAEPIPTPSIPRGMGIALVNGLFGGAVGFIIGAGIGMVAQPANPQEVQMTQLAANAISAPIGFLISCVVLSSMLPTTFARAALVAAMQTVIAIVLVVALVVLATGIAVSLNAGR